MSPKQRKIKIQNNDSIYKKIRMLRRSQIAIQRKIIQNLNDLDQKIAAIEPEEALPSVQFPQTPEEYKKFLDSFSEHHDPETSENETIYQEIRLLRQSLIAIKQRLKQDLDAIDQRLAACEPEERSNVYQSPRTPEEFKKFLDSGKW